MQKEIKVVLSLDDNGFSVKTNKARGEVKGLTEGLVGLANGVVKSERALTDMSRDLKGFSDGFAAMQKSMTSTMEAIQRSVTGSLSGATRSARDTASEAKRAATAQIDAKVKTLQNELDTNRKLIEARGKMFNDLRKAEQAANTRALQGGMQKDARVQSYMKAPIGSPEASYSKMTADVAAIEKQIALHQQNATVIGLEAIKVGEWITAERQAQALRNSTIASLEAQRQEVLKNVAAQDQLNKVSAAVGKSNSAEVDRLKKAAQARDAQAARDEKRQLEDSARQKYQYTQDEVRQRLQAEVEKRRAMAETARLQRVQAQEAIKEQRAQTDAIAQMWRGMAQAYAGAKIEKGLGASVNQADQLQRQEVIVSSLNLPAGEERGLIASSETMAKNLKFMTTLEAIQSRMSAIASIGHNDSTIIDQTLTTAVKAANNLQSLGMAHGDMQSTIRNLYGVVEMRQQTGNADQTNATFDTIYKIITGTAGKVQTQDMETVLRRLGMGASQLSNDGLLHLAAVVDQFKVAGGDGGAGGGVSTVGTAFKMMQAYSLGKGLSNTAVQEFAGAGVLNEGGIDLSKDSAGVLRDAKHAGFKDADLWIKDPVAAVQKIMPDIVKYTQSDKQRGKFYQGRDVNDFDNQMTAVSMYLARLGITTSASQALMVAGDPRSQKRIEHQTSTMKNMSTINQGDAKLQETYARAMQETSASARELGQTIGTTLLPPLKAVMDAFNSFLVSANEFAKANPAATQFTAMAAGAAGLYLSLKGFGTMFGIVGSMGGMLRTMIATLTGAGAAARVAGVAASTSGGLWSGLRASLNNTWTTIGAGANQHMPALKNSLANLALSISGGTGVSAGGRIIEGFRGIGGAATGMARIVGGAFLRMIPLLGQLMLAWDFANLIAGMQVGGARVDTWLVGWGDRMITWATNLWIDITSVFKTGAEAAAAEAEKQQNKKDLLGRLGANGVLTDGEKAEAKADDERNKARAAMDFINDPGYAQREAALNAKLKKEQDEREAKEKAAAARKAALAKADADAKAEAAKNTKKAQDAINTAITDGGKRPDRDPLNEALQEAEGKLNAQKTKLNSLVDGAETVESLRQQAEELIEGKRKADDFSPLHSSKKRPGADDPSIRQLKDVTFASALLNEQIKSITFANERNAASTYEADQAMERIAGNGIEKQTDAFRALSREMLRNESRLGAGTKGFKEWELAKNRALFGQAVADGVNFAAGYVDQNKNDKAGLIDNERARTQAQLAAAAQVEDQKFKMHLDTIEKTRQAEVDAANALGETGDVGRANMRALQAREMIEKEFSDRRAVRAEQDRRALETATEKMIRDWKDVGKAVDDLGAQAGNNFVSMLTSTLGTGRLEVGTFVKGVLTDIANAKLKQVLADPLNGLIKQGTDWLKGSVFGMKDTVAQNAATAAATSRAAADTAAELATAGMGTTIMGQVIPAMEVFAAKMATASGVSLGGIGGLFGSGASSYGGPVGSTEAGAGSIAEFMFADGGIMTSVGPVALRKYANGGIANSPQVALYGEAGPEAYVPLPDGRSIPVTMQGGGGGANVQVNVINQTSNPVNAQQGGVRFDGKQMILDVVLSAATQPGSFRNGMKDAMKGTQ